MHFAGAQIERMLTAFIGTLKSAKDPKAMLDRRHKNGLGLIHLVAALDNAWAIKQLHSAGAGLLLGSDAPQLLNVPGFSLHKELALMVAAGLTPAEALTTGTVGPARYFGAEAEFGRVAVGLDADLVLADANPLERPETLRDPAGVMVRGRWLPRAELRSGLDAIAARNRAPQEGQ